MADEPHDQRRLLQDPRDYQIGALLALLVYGWTGLGFDVRPVVAGAIVATAVGAQFLCTRLWRLPYFEPRSALISGLSLCLLLRTNSLALAMLAAAVAVAGKFLLRWRGKHLFNPTNFALVLLLLCADGRAWVSPGQWGNWVFFGFLLVCLGGVVVHRAARADVTLAFLAAWLAVLFGRSLWLGEPMTIPVHRVQNGALLLFAFFMISDPRTTPDSRAGRVVFAILVALGAGCVQFVFFRTNGLLWSLAACSVLVPALDWLLPGRRHDWKSGAAIAPKLQPRNETIPNRGENYEPIPA